QSREKIADTDSKFSPMIKEFFDAHKEIKDLYITAEHYKLTCGVLLNM
ncbi:3435_t:CDS:1, partial [Gigaspora rosea]